MFNALTASCGYLNNESVTSYRYILGFASAFSLSTRVTRYLVIATHASTTVALMDNVDVNELAM
jgi:hypothetical protein